MNQQVKHSLRVMMLAPANNVHSVKWANALAAAGHRVYLLSVHTPVPCGEPLHEKVSIHLLAQGGWGYVSGAIRVRKLIKQIQPDVLHAHYATGYGLLARLSCRRNLPYMLSVWGTDVYEFPYKSVLHRWLLRGNLQRADVIGSTSLAMKRQVHKVMEREVRVVVTPFGIDTHKFLPAAEQSPADLAVKGNSNVRIGTVKGLHSRYGVDRLLRVFALLQKTAVAAPDMELVIAGEGPAREALVQLAEQLGIRQQVRFLGRVKQSEVPALLHSFDIFVALSRFESFGVAILEASACALPVVVSNADGPSEVVLDGVTGFVCTDQQAALQALQRLLEQPQQAQQIGLQGREHVVRHYSQHECTAILLAVYDDLMATVQRGVVN